MLKEQVEQREKDLSRTLKQLDDDDDFLLQHSKAYKCLKFKSWVHDIYDQLIDWENPGQHLDADMIENQLHRFVDMNRYYCRCHHEENFYLDKLRNLNTRIKNWIAQITAGRDEFTEEQLLAALIALDNFRTGKRTVRCFQKHELAAKFNTKRHHKNLYTHLFVVALYEHVLACFAFGMDRALSSQLYGITNSLLTQGSPTAELT